jgi:hypothetical protein
VLWKTRCEVISSTLLFSISSFKGHLFDELVVQFRAKGTLIRRDARGCEVRLMVPLELSLYLLSVLRSEMPGSLHEGGPQP